MTNHSQAVSPPVLSPPGCDLGHHECRSHFLALLWCFPSQGSGKGHQGFPRTRVALVTIQCSHRTVLYCQPQGGRGVDAPKSVTMLLHTEIARPMTPILTNEIRRKGMGVRKAERKVEGQKPCVVSKVQGLLPPTSPFQYRILLFEHCMVARPTRALGTTPHRSDVSLPSSL